MRGFMGNEHFKKANEWLEKKYGSGGGIDWNSINTDST
jgi:uracil-DNA glycosylase